MGIEVLKRGIIFIDLAVAQIAGLGVLVAVLYLHEPSWWLVQFIALAGAMLSAFLFHWIERTMPDLQEALIGSSFVLAASVALLLLANHPHGGEKIQHLLTGEILFTTWQKIGSHIPIYIGILILWFSRPSMRKGLGFYSLFSVAITSSVQLVGVYVVFASLILPALAVVKMESPYILAWGIGIFSSFFGIMAAALLDLPAGPLLVISNTLVALVVFAKRKAIWRII